MKQELGFIFQVGRTQIQIQQNYSKENNSYFQNLGGGVDLTEEEIHSLLLEVDVDGDGVIQYDEFCGLAVTVIN